MNWIKKARLAVTSLLVASLTCWSPVHDPSADATNPPDRFLSVIIGKATRDDTAEQTALALGANITARWDFINAFAAEVPVDKLTELAVSPSVRQIVPEQSIIQQQQSEMSDNKRQPNHHSTLPDAYLVNAYPVAVDAQKVWLKGYLGSGVTVAVVDTGINSGEDIAGRVKASTMVAPASTNPVDQYGHGTHVAGIIAGDGKNSGRKFIGIAPLVNLVSVKFSDDYGNAREQDLITSLQWVYDNRLAYNIRVVNISSTVTNQQSYKESAVAAAVEQLWRAGVVVVVAAGNKGTAHCSTCYAPANDPYVITVGATDDMGTALISDDRLKPWSSSGLTRDGHQKPDVVAPGSHIISYLPSGLIRDRYPQNIVDQQYVKMGGTSMSAPIVSGVVALMLQVHPEWTPDQVKWVLVNTSRSYKHQPAGTPGIVSADLAAFSISNPPAANQNLEPSPFLDPTNDRIRYDHMQWDHMSWSHMSWSNNMDY